MSGAGKIPGRLEAQSQRRRKQRGSGLIEGALCFSAFLFITFGVMESSMAIYAYNFCSYAARDGARWASVRGANYPVPANSGDVQRHIADQAVGLAGTVNVTTTWLPDNKPGGTVQVTVQYNVIPLTGVTLHRHLTVGTTAQMIISN